jgi:GntR family transcriptional regulator/MocR family aminotransferase
MGLITITFSGKSGGPLYEQLYRHLADEIRAGRLTAGERLPSKRALAAHLHISRNTVEAAYAMLAQEGYVSARPRSGFYVAPLEARFDAGASAAPKAPPSEAAPRWALDLKTNAVDVASFPYRTWARLNRAVLLDGAMLLEAGDPRGDLPLRQALALHLREFRGVSCDASQVVVGAGMEYLLMLLLRLLGGTPVYALEDPGYPKTAALLRGSGLGVRHIPLDAEGMRPDALRQSGAEIAYVTPSHQFPTGCIMPVGRRLTLLAWAGEREGRYVIEDDYNGEFHFSGRPIPAAQGLDRAGRVIYMSTFSRVLAPSIRIGYMVLPPALAARLAASLGSYSSTVSRFEQQTLLRFLSEGYLDRHLARVKAIYRRRRDALTARLRELGIPYAGESAGLHLLLRLSPARAAEARRRAALRRLRLYWLSDFYASPAAAAAPADASGAAEPGEASGEGVSIAPENVLVLGYGALPLPELNDVVTCLFAD